MYIAFQYAVFQVNGERFKFVPDFWGYIGCHSHHLGVSMRRIGKFIHGRSLEGDGIAGKRALIVRDTLYTDNKKFNETDFRVERKDLI